MAAVAVVDYGMGNLRSVSQAVLHVAAGTGLDVIVTSHPAEVLAAERVVLPGQGAMRDCMRELHDSGLKQAVLHAWFYFVHSYWADPSDPRHTAGETEYGCRFTSAVARDNIFATQFHPEKSADHGLALYRNFLHWKP